MLSFEAKTMGRLYLIVVVLTAVASCGLEEIGRQTSGGNEVWVGPGSVVVGNGSGADPDRKVWYAVGVDYPQGYDWRSDAEKGSVRCSLVVFADGVPMMKVPVGDEYEVSSDPDMHRVIGGDLYTDFSTLDETVIKRNGEELLRYHGREMIVGMAVEGESVYTLGVPRFGGGFAFRKDGAVLLQRADGHVFPRLQRVGEGFAFAFYEPPAMAHAVNGRFCCYLDGAVSDLDVRLDVKDVWDVLWHEGQLCFIAVAGDTPVFVCAGDQTVLGQKADCRLENCRFIGEGPYVEGVMSCNDGGVISAVWKCVRQTDAIRMQETFSTGYIVASSCRCDDGAACVLNGPDAFANGIIYRDGKMFKVPSGYFCIGGQSMAMVNGKLHVCLTSEIGGCPAVWIDEKMKPLKINGFISHISID
jgi:hypothetical protein